VEEEVEVDPEDELPSVLALDELPEPRESVR